MEKREPGYYSKRRGNYRTASDRKMQVQIGVRQSVIDQIGGKKKVQELLLNLLTKYLSEESSVTS